LEEIIVYAAHKVLVEVDEKSALIVGRLHWIFLPAARASPSLIIK
jgi:hypothetical protein